MNTSPRSAAYYMTGEFTLDMPSVIEAVEFKLRMASYTRRDLTRAGFGDSSAISKFLAGKRPLSLQQAKVLYRLGMPATILLQKPPESDDGS